MESAHQFSSRPDCNNTAEVRSFTLSNPICFRSVWCRRTTIPGKIFTGFANRGIVSVNELRLPIWLQELLQAPLCFLRSVCFARIRLDPLGGQVLVFRNSIIHEIFSEFSQTFWNYGIQRVIVVSVSLWFGILSWLGQRVSPFFPFNVFTRHRYWIGIYPTQAFPCFSVVELFPEVVLAV